MTDGYLFFSDLVRFNQSTHTLQVLSALQLVPTGGHRRAAEGFL